VFSTKRQGLTFSVLAVAIATTAACTSGRSDSTGTSSSAKPSVVASTNVYGDIASQIGGDKINITSIITNPNADPHGYAAGAQNQLALSKAKIVIENGGGYDDFMDQLLHAANNDSATVLNAVDISGKSAPSGGELNEHVWYDFPTVAKLTTELTTALSAADPADANTFTANSQRFLFKLKSLQATEASIKAKYAGTGVAITEPVPLYLLEASGLVNKTPPAFSAAVEEQNDVPPRVLQETLALFADKQVRLLAYNEQATGPITDKVLAAAKANNIAVVPVTETLPAGKNYLAWMTDTLSAVQNALSK
jgi:zinc/manganese transport system substrate-binding protein